MASAALTVPIDGSTKGLERALRDATQEIQGFGGRIKGTMRGIGTAFIAGFAGLQIGGFLKDSIFSASDLQEAGSKAGEIFGQEMMGGLQAFADSGALDLGMSQQQVLDAASTFGILGKAGGLAGDDLMGFSQEMVQLATDMASFNNTSIDEAIGAIGSGLRGESEPLRRFGVLLDDATLRARALEEGLWDGEGAFTAQTRSLAASAEIMAQTTDQQGDFARTSDGLAGQTKILQAQFANLQTEIGAKLLPIAVALATWFNSEGLPAIQRFGGWMQDNIPPILQAIGDWFERHQETISTVMETIWAVIQRVWSEVSRYIESTLTILQGVWNTFAGLFRGDWDQFWEGIRGILSGAWDKITQVFGLGFDVLKFLAGLAWEWIKDRFWDSVEYLKDTVSDGIDEVKTYFENLPGNILTALGDLGSLLVDAGRAIIQGLWDGMKAVWGEVTGWLGSLGGAIVDLKGPPSYDAVMLTDNGELIMQSLRRGMELGFDRDVAPFLSGLGGGGLSATLAGARTTSPAMAGGTPISVVVELDGRTIAKSMERVSERDGGLRIKTRAGG
jgi:hypothetical protein